MEVTGTNRPRTYTQNQQQSLNASTVQYLKQHTHTLCGPLFHRVTAAIAAGKRPVPFRTRKLSLPAPMVLHSRGCGRVGHRRTQLHTRTPESPTGPGVLAISTSDLFAVCAGNSVVAPQKSCELPIRYKSHRRRLFAGGVAGTVSAGLISATAAPAHTGPMVYTSLPGTMRCSPAR